MLEPYYADDLVTLYHADCEAVVPSLFGYDLVVTSPPYNLGGSPWPHLGNWKPGDSAGGKSKWRNGSDAAAGIQYAGHSDSMPWPEYVAWQRRVLAALWANLADDGAIFYNHKPRVIGGKLWLPLELNPDLPLRQIVIWARAGGMNFNPTAFLPTHEWVMIFAKESWRLKSRAASGIGDVWQVAQRPDPDHPAPFPMGIPARAIDASAPHLVLDPFAGTGTTLRAAKAAGVCAIGIEKSERDCETAARRFDQTQFDLGGAA